MTAELRSFTVAIDTGRWRDTVLTEVDLRLEAGQVTALLGGPGDGKTMISYALTGRLPEVAGPPVKFWSTAASATSPKTASMPSRRTGPSAPSSAIWNCATERGLSNKPAPQPTTRPTRWTCIRSTTPQARSRRPRRRPAHRSRCLSSSRTDRPPRWIRAPAYGVWKSLRGYADTGAAVLVLTHDIPLLTATGYADHLVIMGKGQILAAGSMAELSVSEHPRVQMYFRGV